MKAKNNWKFLLAPAVLVASCSIFAIPANAQIGIGIQLGRSAPPPLRYEVRPVMPGPGYAWVDGYWSWNGRRYVWVPGVWRRPPYAGAYWSHPHWDHYDDGWHYHEGHWDREDHDDHHDWGHDHDRH